MYCSASVAVEWPISFKVLACLLSCDVRALDCLEGALLQGSRGGRGVPQNTIVASRAAGVEAFDACREDLARLGVVLAPLSETDLDNVRLWISSTLGAVFRLACARDGSVVAGGLQAVLEVLIPSTRRSAAALVLVLPPGRLPFRPQLAGAPGASCLSTSRRLLLILCTSSLAVLPVQISSACCPSLPLRGRAGRCVCPASPTSRSSRRRLSSHKSSLRCPAMALVQGEPRLPRRLSQPILPLVFRRRRSRKRQSPGPLLGPARACPAPALLHHSTIQTCAK